MADPRERMKDLFIAIMANQQAHEADIWTALPGIAQSFSAAEMTVSVQPAIKAQQRGPDGEWNYKQLPVLIHCPVLFPGGGGFVSTFPIAAGDEGLVVFASRCIDNWWVQGDVQTQADLRMHDLSDGFFLPICFSQPNVPTSVSTDTAQLRTVDGEAYIELTADHKVNIVVPLTGAVTIKNLPTSASGLLSGALWNSGGTLMIVP